MKFLKLLPERKYRSDMEGTFLSISRPTVWEVAVVRCLVEN